MTTKTVTQSCEPSEITLPDVLPLVALAGLLLIGELSEVSIPGILSLKTKVQQQELKQEELEKQLLDVRLTANQQQAVNNYFGDAAYQNPRAANASAHEKANDGIPGSSPTGVAATNGVGIDSLKYQVISRYETIGPFVLSAQLLATGRPPKAIARRLAPTQREAIAHMSDASWGLVNEWFFRFRPEIEAVRGVRNSVAHPPSLVTEDDLQATLDTIDVLRAELQKLGLVPEQDLTRAKLVRKVS